MKRIEVLIVGAGPAGIAAALRLARAGVSVLVLEGGEFAGAENWSGCVYHGDPLLREDVLGAELWRQAPKERRVVARSLFFHDGIHAAGFEARAHERNGYGEAWTVLRPKLDRWLAARAIELGATLLPGTTVTGLRYHGTRITGVNTDRGPVEADVVFLAEGDAAGLLAREGLEIAARPHFAQGIKAVFRLPSAEIERRFNLGPGEGAAQEWLLRNRRLAGRPVDLNATAFIYTNADTLSVGLVLPLDRLARAGAVDHAHLLRWAVENAGIAPLLEGAQQVAYGAKVIRAGGLLETPVWVRDGLAVGGSALGIGMEFPYPNFIGPALTSGVCFADAIVSLRGRSSRYEAVELERAYAARLRQTPDFANAELMKRWPAAIHGGPLFFERMPALLNQLIGARDLPPSESRAQVRRAFGHQLLGLSASIKQAMRMVRGLKARRVRRAERTPPLDVRFLAIGRSGVPQAIEAETDPLLRVARDVIGHFYGRRLPDMRQRLSLVRRCLRGSFLVLSMAVARRGLSGVAGALHLLGDLSDYKIKRIPLRALLLRPYHRHEEASLRVLRWAGAKRIPLSPAAWLAPIARPLPDQRHLTLPLEIAPAAARELRSVCPAEVYRVVGRLGGADSQHENCIKCESCRVSVPGIDWNRNSAHRLVYRIPGDGRFGPDGSVSARIEMNEATRSPLSSEERATLEMLHSSLRARPRQVGPEWIVYWRGLIRQLHGGRRAREVISRIEPWFNQGAYGWVETELAALLDLPPAAGREPAIRSIEDHAARAREHRWQGLLVFFDAQRLQALSERPWGSDEKEALLRWLNAARTHRPHAVRWLARHSPALAWIAASHFLAESYAGRAIAEELAAPFARLEDGRSNWLPACASRCVDPRGNLVLPGEPVARGAGLDAAQPRRFAADVMLPGAEAGEEGAALALELALGMGESLRARAREYAGQRVQFRDLKDREGRESIGKFGAIKMMLAGIEQAVTALELARERCAREPRKVLALAQARMGVRMDAVPWMAGQIVGGMAYSEEDVFAPRYRDAMLLAQWPLPMPAELPAVHAFAAQLLRSAPALRPGEQRARRDLTLFTRTRLSIPQISPALLRGNGAAPSERTGRAKPLAWQGDETFAYRSGAFLNGSLLASGQLLTPEHFRRDPKLRATRAAVLRLLRRGFRSQTKGEPYGRYIDALHGVPERDVAALAAFNAFATIVPERLGGKGWSKADYAVLNMLSMGRGDTSLGLLIMASTSIGTMPVILGMEQDLPRLERELRTVLGNAAGWQGLEQRLDSLIALLIRPDPSTLKAGLAALGALVRQMFMEPGSALKYLARDYLLLLEKTVEAAKSRDLDALREQLVSCRDALPALKESLHRERSALPLRAAAHARFLRFLATGQISAFALTEPGAGSDTGALRTRAVLRRVAAEPCANGFYRFVPDGGHKPRVLLDAQRLLFDGRRVRYRLADGSLGRLDDSQWDGARNTGRRLVRAGRQTYAYDDIGTAIKRDGAWVYEYWELTGNKMWITNGSIADRYCIYAQTEFGETGFMLERRSAGLRIGPNEHKLGQRASPTNELTLDRVRVSADQIIGFRGHGQVNALETLSVGRGGLVMGCATMAEEILAARAALWAAHPALERAARFELDRLQTLAARLVGLMDCADLARGDFRIEAALSKYLASEGLHRILLWLEAAEGPMAAAKERMTEKWRRDARVLNIYEGTNEVQRFLVLKDLPKLLASFAPVSPEASPVVIEHLPLDGALRAFREFAAPRLEQLGQRVWQDPELQARWFPVVDWAGELYVWCALHERVRLLETQGDPVDRPAIRRLRQTMDHLALFVDKLATHVTGEFAAIEGEEDGVLAGLGVARDVLNRQEESADFPVCVGSLSGQWIVLLRSRAELNGGGLTWAGWHADDLAVLDRLLDWRDAHPALSIGVVATAPQGCQDRLRRLEAAGAQLLHIVQPLDAPLDAAVIAGAIREHWPAARRFAFGGRPGSAEAANVRHLAALLEADLVEGVAAVGGAKRGGWIEDAAFRRHYLAHARPVGFLWQAKPSGRSDLFSVRDWLTALRAPLPAAEVRVSQAFSVREVPVEKRGDVPGDFADPEALAAWLRQAFAGPAEPEPAARQTAVSTPPAAPVLWLARSDTLAAVHAQPALSLLHALAPERFAVMALQPNPHEQFPISSHINQPGFEGVWTCAVRAGPRATASALAPLLEGRSQILLGEGDQELAAALAAALGWPLLAGIVGVQAGTLLCAEEGFAREHSLPPRAVLVASPALPRAALRASPQPVPIFGTRIPAVKTGSLERWLQAAASKGQGLEAAPVIIDVGIGIGDRQRFEELVTPLHAALSTATGRPVELGATRKVTQELKLLAPSQQIGQTGVAVAPELLLALGVSGAPQHMGWIARNATVIAINRDPEAPIFNWQQENPAGPRVVRCVGDLREWIPRLVRALAAAPEAASDETHRAMPASASGQ